MPARSAQAHHSFYIAQQSQHLQSTQSQVPVAQPSQHWQTSPQQQAAALQQSQHWQSTHSQVPVAQPSQHWQASAQQQTAASTFEQQPSLVVVAVLVMAKAKVNVRSAKMAAPTKML